MKWKEVYNKSNNSEYTQLINIKEPVKLEANFKKFFSSYKVIIILILIAFIVLSFMTFKLNIKTILACAFVLTISVLISIYYRSYKINIE